MIKDINIMAQPFKIIVIIFIVISIIIDIKMVLEEIKKKDRHNKRSREPSLSMVMVLTRAF